MIKFLIMDVDGTLTDGMIYMGAGGEIFKSFNIKDGCGIKDILPQYDIEPIIITARYSKMLEKRCQELGIKHLYQNERHKFLRLKNVLQELGMGKYTLKDCAYIGDDILDLQCMIPIKEAGGVIGCPADAVEEVKAVADFISDINAGQGAVRDFIYWLIKVKPNLEDLQKRIDAAFEYIMDLSWEKLKEGKYEVDDRFFYLVQEYYTQPVEKCLLESHRKYVDIQVLIDGEEILYIADIAGLHVCDEYSEEKDVMFWRPVSNMVKATLQSKSSIILYPNNAHMGCIKVNEACRVKKIVGKVSVC